MYCTNCGAQNPDTNKFCNECGRALTSPAAQPAPVPPPVRNKRPIMLAGGAIVVIILIVAAALFALRTRGGGDHVLLMTAPDLNSENAALYFLKLGQDTEEGVRVAENADVFSNFLQTLQLWGGVAPQPLSGYFGAFVPGTDRLVYLYKTAGGRQVVGAIQGGADAPSDLLSQSGDLAGVITFAESETVVLLTDLSGGQLRCYVSRRGEKAKRVGRDDWCWPARGGESFVTVDTREDESSLSLVNAAGGNQQTLLANEPGIVNDLEERKRVMVSADGSHILYVQETGSGQQLYLMEREDDEPTPVGAEYDQIETYGFLANRDDAYYVARDYSADSELFVSTEETPLASGAAIIAASDATGKRLIYQIQDSQEANSIFVHTLGQGEDVEIFSGEELRFALIESPARILIYAFEGSESVLYSANMDGEDLVEIFRGEFYADEVRQATGDAAMLILTSAGDGSESLFVAPVNEVASYSLLEGWYEIEPLNRSIDGQHLVFLGQELAGDEIALYAIANESGSTPVLLDAEYDRFFNGLFSADGQHVLYNAISDDGALNVCQVPIDGSQPCQILYEHAALWAAEWSPLQPFQEIPWQPNQYSY